MYGMPAPMSKGLAQLSNNHINLETTKNNTILIIMKTDMDTLMTMDTADVITLGKTAVDLGNISKGKNTSY
jgi:hypothetical protein